MSARAWLVATQLTLALAFVVPFGYMLSVSLQAEGHGLERGPLALLGDARPENYVRALEKLGDVPRLFANTLWITVLSVVGQCLTCSLAGYAFARVRFRGRDGLFLVVLATMMLPDQVTAIPRFLFFRAFDSIDTFVPLVLPTVLGGAPFFVFLFRQYFLSLPAELTEAAVLDGASHLRIWWSVMLPLARPMLVTVGTFTFLATWNDFWAPLVYLLSPEQSTLTLALAGFNRSYNVAVEHMMAAASFVLAPCILVYFLAQRLFLRGVQVAASKH